MLEWSTLPLDPGVELRIVGALPPLTPEIDAAVEAHWAQATAARSLFNGRIFCADHITPGSLTGHWTEYRRIVAQMADPGLFNTLKIRSLAVCGILCCPDGIVVGRREPNAIYQPGLWQLPPAGSVDHCAATPHGADWRRAILAELQEELGLPSEAAAALTPICLVQHPTGVLDMGIRIDTSMSATEILARHRTLGDGEYDQLRILPHPDLLAMMASSRGEFVPAAHMFLDHLPPATG